MHQPKPDDVDENPGGGGAQVQVQTMWTRIQVKVQNRHQIQVMEQSRSRSTVGEKVKKGVEEWRWSCRGEWVDWSWRQDQKRESMESKTERTL
jgi:hypothetical protein